MTSQPDDRNLIMNALPPAVRAALQAQDVQALDLALRQLPMEEAEAIMGRLVTAGVLARQGEADLDREQRQAYWPPSVAEALATGNREAVTKALAELPPDQADQLTVELQQQGLL